MRPRGFWEQWEQWKSAFISGEQLNKGQVLSTSKTMLGNKEHKKTNIQLRGKGVTSQFISVKKGTGTSWESLYIEQIKMLEKSIVNYKQEAYFRVATRPRGNYWHLNINEP